MTDSDDLMDAFPGFSTQCHKKVILSKKKKKKKRKERFFLGDYHPVSPLMNIHVATRKIQLRA